MDVEQIRSAGDYIAVIVKNLPLAGTGAVVAIMLKAPSFYQCTSFRGVIAGIICTSCVGFAAAFICVCALPLLPYRPSAEIELLLASMGGAFGQKAVDWLAFRLFNKDLLK